MDRPPFDIPALIGDVYARTPATPPTWRELGVMDGFPPAPGARVTRRNFMYPPLNKWAFQHVCQLLPTIDVPAPAVSRELPRADLPLDTTPFRSICGREVSVAEHLKASDTDAFIVLHDGVIRFEHYANAQTPETRHIMFSVTKSMIGTLAESLVAQGRLDPASLVRDIVPELADSAFGDATVRQVMDMAVGVHYREDYEDPRSESSQFGYASGLYTGPADESAELPAEYAGLDNLYAFLPRLKKRGEHGGFFEYVTAVTEVLAWTMERATGQACHEMLARVWAGLGCERDGYFIADPMGRNVAGAGFSATLRDMARFGQMLLDDGKVGSVQVLPAGVVRTLLRGGSLEEFAANKEFAGLGRVSYKSQWYVFNDHALLAIGVHGQQIFVDFDARMVSIKQSSTPAAVAPINFDGMAMLGAIAARLRDGGKA